MQHLVAIVRNPVTGFIEVVHPPMKLTELIGLLDMAKMQAYENYKHSGNVVIGGDTPTRLSDNRIGE